MTALSVFRAPPQAFSRAAFVVALLLLLLPPALAQAQLADNDDEQLPPPLLDRPRAFGEERTFEVYGRLGYASMHGAGDSRDRVLFGLGMSFSMVNWTLALDFEVPVHVDPVALERNAFNEASDFFAILEALRYGYKDEGAAFFNLGRFSGRETHVGYGHFVNHYSSTVDMDSPLIGLQFDFDFGGLGYESFVNSFTDWDVIALRGFVRPLVLAGEPQMPVTDTELGITIAGDFNAPTSLRLDDDEVLLDSKRNIRARTTDLLYVAADLTVPLIYDTWVELRPFVSGAVYLDHGAAAFAGLDLRLYVPIWDSLPLDVRLEYHHLGRGFAPFWADTFYLVERYAFPTPESTRTKLGFMREATRSSSGVAVSLRWGLDKLFAIEARYADYFEAPAQHFGRLILHLRMLEGSGLPFRVGATYAKRGVASFAEAFRLDETAMLRAYAAIQPFNDLDLRFGVTLERTWRVETTTGRYDTATAITPYITLAFAFD